MAAIAEGFRKEPCRVSGLLQKDPEWGQGSVSCDLIAVIPLFGWAWQESSANKSPGC